MITLGSKISQFRIRDPHRQRLLDTEPRWGHGGLSEVTFYRTYSRQKPDGTQESWQDCVVRVVEGMFSILRTHAAQNRMPWSEERGQRHALEAATRLMSFKWTPPGRGLWMMGTNYVWERGGAALNNCAFVSTKELSPTDDEATVAPFRFLMDCAMVGIGPGFDTRGAGKVGIAGYSGAPITHRVADSREGWVDVVGETIRNILFGGPQVIPDVQDVRPLGARLVGFGGVASGPDPLVQGLRGIEDILLRRRGQELDSVSIVDVMNLIGKIVVAGNVRRTAEIGFAEPGDSAFASMKDWRRHPTEMGSAPPEELRAVSPEDFALYEEHQFTPHTGVARSIAARYAAEPWSYKFGGWRWASNNSIFATVGMDYRPYNDPIAASGEPGFEWLELARSHGRLRDPANHKDHRVDGANPCFTGDTLVAVADGRNAVPIRELVGTTYPVYTVGADGLVTIGKSVKTWLTRKNAEIWRLTLDDGSEIRATPDHKIMLRSGGYKPLSQLVPGESLMPFDSNVRNKGYRHIFGTRRGSVRSKQAHMIWEFNTGERVESGYDLHHLDHDKLNDEFSNLNVREHRRHASEHSHERAEQSAENLRRLWTERHGDMCNAVRRGRGLPERVDTHNHRVVSVEFCGYEDVYDMTVAGTNNFAVITTARDETYSQASGIFVHNCVEQSLESYEMCNLVENYPSHATDYWDFQRSLKFSYLYAKAVTLMGTHVERTNEIIIRNRRIGCSMSGVADTIARVGRTEFFSGWCERAYTYVGYLDRKYSDWLGVRESVKKTSMKPSGTVSLVAGVFGPGAHFPKATGYRLMRLAAGSPIVTALEAARYRVEPSVTDPTGTVVAYFPWIVPEGTLTEDEVGLWEQVRMAADLQHWWADNQVSYTATFTAAEAERGEISRVLEAHDGQLKGISFLTKEEGNYAQMPFTRAPRAEVEVYAARLAPLGLGRTSTHETEDRFCDGAACEIKPVAA